MPDSSDFSGRRVLIVEDDYFIADEVADHFMRQGAIILGPVGSVDDAMSLVSATAGIDAALLDINLHGEMAYRIADALIERGVPFVFATGYDRAVIPDRYADVPRCPKPVAYRDVAKALHVADAGAHRA